MRAAAAAVLAPVALGAGALAWWRWQHRCCEIDSENFEELVVCAHSKAWYRGVPRAGQLGPFGYMRVPGWVRITQGRAMRMMQEELDLDVELISFGELGEEEEDDGGQQQLGGQL